MSKYEVIKAVDETLRTLLWENKDTTISSILGSSDERRISFQPPFHLMKDTEPDQDYLSLFLYRVVENGEMKNRSLEHQNGNLFQYPPLSLNLFYLITPLTKDNTSPEKAHILLGKSMQIFYDNAVIKGSALKGVLKDTTEELRIILNPISMEDITKLWSSFMRPYHLSVSYEVKVVYIDSERQTEAERVRRKQIQYKQLTGA